jgi:4-amino-4-deoxy-L-arabinose transferase-like glycosyltransferase
MTTLAVAERGSLRGIDQPFADRALAFLERSHLRVCAALIALALGCLLPGFFSLHPLDRDEARYAQASKQMLETGDFVDIRFQNETRYKKPVGIYWMQSASVAAAEALGVPEARTTIALYRIPSLLGALATILLSYWAALAFLDRRGAFLAAALMAACLMLAVEARQAKTDAVLTACTVAVMGTLARIYLARGSAILPARTVVLFWLALAVGILVKGPLILLYAGLAAAVLSLRERSASWLLALRPGWGLPLSLLVVLPWFGAIVWKSGNAFFAASVGKDLLGKVGTAQMYHWAPPGLYALLFFLTFWPGAILAAMAAPSLWANRRDDAVAFGLAWIIPTWIVFEIVPTKLPHYVLPLYPMVAILTVLAISRGTIRLDRPGARWAALALPLIPIVVGGAIIVAAFQLDGRLPLAALPAFLVAVLLAFAAWRYFIRGEPVRTAVAGLLSSVALMIGLFGLAHPVMRSLKVSPRLAEVARGLTCPNPQFGSLGYREPSAIFTVGTSLTLFWSPAHAAEFLKGGSCRMAFVERRFEPEFRAAAARLGVVPALTTRVTGFNVNGGRRVDIAAYAVRP